MNCNKAFEQPKGKREKIFCSDTCRASFSQKKGSMYVKILKDEYRKLLESSEMALEKHLKESKKETTTTAGVLEVAGLKVKKYDYSSIPENTPYNKKKVLMAKIREEQDKIK